MTETEVPTPFTPEETASIEAYLRANLDTEIKRNKGAFGWPLDVARSILVDHLKRPTHTRDEVFWIWQYIRGLSVERYGTPHPGGPRNPN